jgi:hypothetical protein
MAPIVMAGLDPAIQTFFEISSVFLDGRIQCGHDNRGCLLAGVHAFAGTGRGKPVRLQLPDLG